MRPRASLLVGALALALVPAIALAETEIADIEDGATAAVVWTGLNKPVDIAFGPDGALYYAEFDTGKLQRIAPGASAPDAQPVWTAPNLQLGGERGFVGLAVHDDAFYVFYQTNKSGTVVSRFSKIVDGAEQVLLDDIKSGLLHNSGRIAFTPDDKILLAVGDATLDTVGRNAARHAHDPTSLNGKVLRLELDGSPAPGNPWGNEVWSKGHRNVYGLAVSPAGVVLSTENGPDHWDEVDILKGGEDHGWPTCSGACDPPDAQFVDPILAYYSTISPTGAAWYDGNFYFTDFNKGTVHRVYLAQNGSYLDERVLKFTTPRIIDVEAGPDGLYVSTWDSIWKVTPAVRDSHWPVIPNEAPPTPPSTSVVPDDPKPTTPATSGSPPPASSPTEDVKAPAQIPGPAVVALVGILLGIALLRGREFK